MNRFYKACTDAVVNLDGTVDKFVGDQIMAFFGAPFRPEDHAARSVQAALAIVTNASRLSPDLKAGGAVSTGTAFVGNVGAGKVTDFTALGDVVNVAARLQGQAAAGEVLLTDDTYARVKNWYPQLEQRELDLKGKTGRTTAWVLHTQP